MAAAAVLASCHRATSRPALDRLLADPDAVVRRVAAESVFGGAALGEDLATRYGYTEVVAAEKRVRELLGVVRRSGLAGQYRATQDLIALGWPAVWELHRWRDDRREALQLSALYALDEIAARHENIPPAWAREIQRKLKEATVSLDYEGTPLEVALDDLSKSVGIPIRFRPGMVAHDQKVFLRLRDVKLESALGWLTKLIGATYAVDDGGIVVYGRGHLDGYRTVLVDVRDLEAAGIRPDWRRMFRAQAFGDQRRFDCEPVAADGESPGFESRGGILLISFMVSAGDPAARDKTTAIREYLDRLRHLIQVNPDFDEDEVDLGAF